MSDDVPPTVEDGEDDAEYDDAAEGAEAVNIVDEAMQAVLEAAEAGDTDTLSTLLEGVSIDSRGEDGDTALHIGCLHGQMGVVEECLKRGADVNVCDEDGSTPLHDAAAGGYVEIVGALLGRGARVGAADSDGDTPLHHACRGGHPPVVSALLTHAAGQDGFAALVDMKNEAGEKAIELVDDGDRAAIAPLFGLG